MARSGGGMGAPRAERPRGDMASSQGRAIRAPAPPRSVRRESWILRGMVVSCLAAGQAGSPRRMRKGSLVTSATTSSEKRRPCAVKSATTSST